MQLCSRATGRTFQWVFKRKRPALQARFSSQFNWPSTEEEFETMEAQWETEKNEKLEAMEKLLLEKNSSEDKKRVEALVDALFELQDNEKAVIMKGINEANSYTQPIHPTNVSPYLHLDSEVDSSGTLLQTDADMEAKLRAIISNEGLLAKMGLGGGGGGGSSEAAAASTEAEAPKEPEKTAFDVELTAFPPSAKIKLIKELKDTLKLGLKEAKELVERAPVIIKEGLKRDEAESLQKKIVELGCESELK